MLEFYSSDGKLQFDLTTRPIVCIGTALMPTGGASVRVTTGYGPAVFAFDAPINADFRPKWQKYSNTQWDVSCEATSACTLYYFSLVPPTPSLHGTGMEIFNESGDVIYSTLYEPMDVAGYYQTDTGVSPAIVNFTTDTNNILIMPMQGPAWGVVGPYMGNWDGTNWYEYYFTNGNSQSWRRTTTGVRVNINQVFSEIDEAEAAGGGGGSGFLSCMTIKKPRTI